MPIRKTRPIDMIFCLPGNNFSSKYMQSWTNTVIYCMSHGINAYILEMYSSNVYHVRECFLAQNVLTETQNIKPFGGKLYDYVMHIDSDQVWKPQDIEALIARDTDVVSGAIRVAETDQYAFGWFDEQLLKESNQLKRMTVEQMEGKKALIDVDFLGLAFTLVKYGVFEKIRFPWFSPLKYKEYKPARNKVGWCGEDLSICKRLKDKGVSLYIDPELLIGHEKTKIY